MRSWNIRLALGLFVVACSVLAATGAHSTRTVHGVPMQSAYAEDSDDAATPTSTATPSSSTFYRMEAEAMTPVGEPGMISDPAASGGHAVKAWTNVSGVGGSATFSTSRTYAFTIGGPED